MARKRPPRVKGFDYTGLHTYFLTICCDERRSVFLDIEYGHSVGSKFLQLAADHALSVIAYILMPDHLHAVLEGVDERTDFRRFVASFKQQTAFHRRAACGEWLWQEGYYDHVLRSDESVIGVAAYILQNPIRAGLCKVVTDYPLIGSSRYTVAEIIDAVQCPRRRSRR